MATQSRLQKSEIGLEGRSPENGWRVVIQPVNSRERIGFVLEQGAHDVCERFWPDDAYYIGKALVEHAIECGYDPEEGE